MEEFNETQMCELISMALEEITESEDVGRLRIKTFEDAGVLTSNKGLVVRIDDAEFEVTVVQSR